MWQYSSSISWICEDISQARETFHMIKSAFAEILNNLLDDLYGTVFLFIQPLLVTLTSGYRFYGITRLRKEDG